ncbi:MAG: hypothetical protein ACFFAK_01535 [Promethearchaeota archaeon]
MKKSNFNKTKRIVVVLLLFLGMVTPTLVKNILVSGLNNKLYTDENDVFREENDCIEILPKLAESLDFDGTGEQMNVTLHQSLIDTTTKQFTDLDISNRFSEPFPDFNGYSTSFINVSIDNIYAPNKTLIVEDDAWDNADNFDNANPSATSFRVLGDGYLENVSFYVRNVHATAQSTVTVVLYNSTWDGNKNMPYGTSSTDYLTALGTFNVPASTTGTFSVNNVHQFLNNSITFNKTWFIGLFDGGAPGADTIWYYVDDDIAFGDGIDETYSYSYSGGWVLTSNLVSGSATVDFRLEMDLSPINNIPNPEHIGLAINDTKVTGYSNVNGSGYWHPIDSYSSSSNELNFTISAGWWNVSCDVTNVQINYTKSNLLADSSFEILNSGDNVQWNVSATGGLNFFDSRITDFNTINFTIPSTWILNTIKVFNETEIPGIDIKKDFIKDGYRFVQVLNAGNGSNWYLIANSTNLLSSINTYVGGVATNIANFSNVIEFNTSFSEFVNNGILNLSVYSSIPRYLNHTNLVDVSLSPGTELFVYNWDISDNATQYGVFKAQIFWNNDTAAGFIDSYFTIVGDTSLSIVSPPENSIFLKGENFNITIEYNDIILSQGIADATVEYSLDGGSTYNSTAVQYIGNGRYNLTVRVADPDFPSYGFVDVIISASETFYVNLTDIYTFHRQITTDIYPSNSPNLGSIIRGQNVSYTFDYYDTDLNYIIGASWEVIGDDYNFEPFLKDYGNGTYTMQLDTDDVDVGSQSFTFNVSKIGAETQIVQLNVDIQIIQTRIESTTWITEIPRNSGLNQTFNFYFNDTTNDRGIEILTKSNIVVRDNSTGIIWTPGWELVNLTNGWYDLNISLTNKNYGWYTLEVNASKFPNYGYDLSYFTFYLRGNYSDIDLKSVSDPGGQIESIGAGYNYTIFEGSDITVDLNITDLENNNKLVSTLADTYTVYYRNLNTGDNGTLANSFQIVSQNHRGFITTSNPALTIGNYEVNITVNKLNYEEVYFMFNLTVIGKYQANLTAVVPDSVNAGLPFTIIVKAEYFNGSVWLPINDSTITIIPYYNGIAGTSQEDPTNSTGEIEFTIPTYSDTSTFNLTIQLSSAYNHQEFTLEISDITIIPPSGLNLKEFLPYIIIAAIVVVGILGAVAIQRGVIAPKKREKARILNEVKTIFDDAINLEHILVLYKETGTCVYFKSYGSEQIDPELIGGFLTAVSSFGREMVAQEALNEISYGDKMLLLADGEYIRIALVLTKKASLILRRNLREFINVYEETYKDVLPNWRGQLAHFRNSGQIVDDLLSTSIILPHQISYDFSSIKELKNPHSREVLKIAHSCCEEADRQFFFIATLLKEASERTNKDTAEIFMGIKELRDKKMLIPIEISALEAQPISQQEINLINQKVSQLTKLSPEEKQKLVNDLAQLGPVEREAYLSSITERQKIVSAPIKSKIGTIEIANKKEAKSGIKELFNRAKKAKSKKNYQKSVEIFQEAALIASNWELSKEFMQLEELTRKTKIEDLTTKKKQFENEAKLAVKKKNYLEAAQKYKHASKIASEIFKLGVTNMTKEVKRLTNKANEYEKLK